MTVSSKDFSIDFAAAKTETYLALTDEKNGSGPGIGRFDGSTLLVSTGLNGPNSNDTTESLTNANQRPAIGQIVVWETMIEVDKSVKTESAITLTLRFGLDTTSGVDYGFDFEKGILSAFVDTKDKNLADPGGNATVKSVSAVRRVDGEKSSSWMEVDITVAGLNGADKVPVEIWTVLRDTGAEKFTGVVQSRVEAATRSDGSAIGVGDQTIPLKLKGGLDGGQLSGTARLDADNDGITSAGDKAEAGVVVFIDRNGNGKLDGDETYTKTDSEGRYSFGGLDKGSYTILELVPDGTKQLGGPKPITISSTDDVITGVDFLNRATVTAGSISGTTRVDADDSKDASPGDGPGAGVTVYLDANDNGALDPGEATAVTDKEGGYRFTGLSAGTYVVRELVPDGSSEILAPEKITIGAEGGAVTGADFLYAPIPEAVPGGTILGSVWLDTEVDNAIGTGDAKLAGVVVFIDRNGDETLDAGDLATKTDDDGNYGFSGLDIGTYSLFEVLPDGTTELLRPSPVTLSAKDQLVTEVDFLEQKIGAGASGLLVGRVALALPVGLCGDLAGAVFPNVLVTLLNEAGDPIATATTDANGKYAFDHLGAGVYTVHIDAPTGTLLALGSQADSGPVTVEEAGVAVDVDFGLRHLTGTALDGDATLRTDPNAYDVTSAQYVIFDAAGQVNINVPGAYIVGGTGGLTASSNAAGQYIIGGAGTNLMHGGPNGAATGGSILVGGASGNTFEGTSGNDIIIGGCGLNLMQGLGSVGVDAPHGLAGFDILLGGESPDTIEGNNSVSMIAGGGGNDEIHGNGTIIGGANDGGIHWDGTDFQNVYIGDRLDGGGGGVNVFVYQAGDGVQWIQNHKPEEGDRLEIYGYQQPAVVGTWNGFTVWYFGENAALLFNNAGPADNVTYFGAQAAMSGAFGHFDPLPPTVLSDSIHVFTGTTGDDIAIGGASGTTFTGNGGDDLLIGGAGNDEFFGGTGNTSMYGLGGHDIFHGGSGNDTFFVDSQDEYTEEQAGHGIDTVVSTASVQLFPEVENLTLVSDAGDLVGVGNELANGMIGNQGNNALLGYGGDDTISGGGGNDVILGVDGNDVLNGDRGIDYLAGGTGDDTVNGGSDADAIYGEDGNDLLTGGSDFAFDFIVAGEGNDTLDGASGHGDQDFLIGQGGDDTYYVDTPFDLVIEDAGGGFDTVIVTIDGGGYYLYANIENMMVGGSTPFGVGNAGDNVLTGSAGTQWLFGGDGNDTINGGADFDVLFGEAGADTFVFERGTGGDVIGDFQVGIDKIKLVGVGLVAFDLLGTALVENDGTTAINLGEGDFIVLNGVANASLSAGDFIFA